MARMGYLSSLKLPRFADPEPVGSKLRFKAALFVDVTLLCNLNFYVG